VLELRAVKLLAGRGRKTWPAAFDRRAAVFAEEPLAYLNKY
jgi:hypothetical protein